MLRKMLGVFGGGGVMITFLELANLVARCVGWGDGVMTTFLELANMVDATRDVGVGGGDGCDTLYTAILARYACCS